MKLISVDYNDMHMIVSFDFWEIESLGYDIIKQKDVTGSFYCDVIAIIEPTIKKYFGEAFSYGIKTIIDSRKGLFYYEIMPYQERLDEFIVEEWKKDGKRWIWYSGEFT